MYFLNVKNVTIGSMDLEKKHSTIIAILEMAEGLTTTMYNPWSSIAVFTYLKNKAFDTVDNSMLLQKLEHHALEL